MACVSVDLVTGHTILTVRGAKLHLSPAEARQVSNLLQNALKEQPEPTYVQIMRERLNNAYQTAPEGMACVR